MSKILREYTRDIAAVAAGEKPLVVISQGKVKEYQAELLVDLIDELKDDSHDVEFPSATCEDGFKHWHIVFGKKAHVSDALKMLEHVKAGMVRRCDAQFAFGTLFGYSLESIREFQESDVSKSCPCDWCGGPETVTMWED